MIDISNEDFGTLCICALRYCHGRRTYMPSLVQEIVTTHFNDLDSRALAVIADDERFQKDMELWGDNCDKVDWQKFYRSLEQFRASLEQKVCEIAECDYHEYCKDRGQTDCAWK